MALQSHPDKENLPSSPRLSMRDPEPCERGMGTPSETPMKTPARQSRTKTPTNTPTKAGKVQDFTGQVGGPFPVKNTFIHYGSPVKNMAAVTTPPKTVPHNFA